jgi:hypothetical protein
MELFKSAFAEKTQAPNALAIKRLRLPRLSLQPTIWRASVKLVSDATSNTTVHASYKSFYSVKLKSLIRTMVYAKFTLKHPRSNRHITTQPDLDCVLLGGTLYIIIEICTAIRYRGVGRTASPRFAVQISLQVPASGACAESSILDTGMYIVFFYV